LASCKTLRDDGDRRQVRDDEGGLSRDKPLELETTTITTSNVGVRESRVKGRVPVNRNGGQKPTTNAQENRPPERTCDAAGITGCDQ
jgi:hypothetical protein